MTQPTAIEPTASTKTRPATRSAVERRLVALGDPARAAVNRRFFKTGAGEYGEGDRFIGLSVPTVRRVAAEYRDLPIDTLELLLASPWHEVRLFALLVLARAYARAGAAERARIYRLYLARTDRINNWDLVDASAEHIVGAHLYERDRAPLRRLARSPLVWNRRIAVLATFHFIRRGDHSETLRLAEALLGDEHDLMHKAVGWMLREVGKRDRVALERFLDRHAARMPRTMLRYAIERLPATTRRRYLGARARLT